MTSVGENSLSPPERLAALALPAIALLLRVPYAFHYRFNSDEPQHLHVVWAWTNGFLPYRDLFDNHPPLFHLLMAPVLAVVGETARALPLMRLAQLPMWLAALVLTYLIARTLYGVRAAVWASALLAIHFEFFFTSLEFRSDVLWTVAWLAALAALAGGPLTRRRALWTGFLLGVATAASLKTVLLAASLACAALVERALVPGAAQRWPLRRVVWFAAWALAGALAVPGAVAAGFAAAGALPPLLSCTVGHNALPGLGAWQRPWQALLLPVGVAATALACLPLARGAAGDRVRSLRLVVLVTGATYVLAVKTAWPLVTAQDLLPAYPLAAIVAAGAVATWHARTGASPRAGARPRRWPVWAAGALVVGELAVIVLKGPAWRDRGAPAIALVATALRLTDPGDVVMDAKGETVFRRRAWYWALESVTRERLRRGVIRDSIPEELAAQRCGVATLDDPRFPPAARAFLAANFVPVGRLRVAGKVLTATGGPSDPLRFALAIPGEYAVVGETGPAGGTLDGTPLDGPRTLAAGEHELVPSGPGRVAVVWAKAAERGFSPFGHDGGDR